jgi:hypothetical protein
MRTNPDFSKADNENDNQESSAFSSNYSFLCYLTLVQFESRVIYFRSYAALSCFFLLFFSSPLFLPPMTGFFKCLLLSSDTLGFSDCILAIKLFDDCTTAGVSHFSNCYR